MTGPRAVLDTNVLLFALLFHTGTLTWIRNAWQSDVIHPLASRATVEELIRVLGYPKFRLTRADQQELLDDYLPCCQTVDVPADIAIPPCRDPADRAFLALALAAHADALVTGDHDLLAMTEVSAVPILTPAAFRKSRPEL